MADFEWAIKMLKEGKKVRRKFFAEKRYLFVSTGSTIEIDGMGNYPFKVHDFEATDWEIYCEEHDWEVGRYVPKGNGTCDSSIYCKNCGKEKLVEKPKESLSDKRKDILKDRTGEEWSGIYLQEEDTKEKIQNARRRIESELHENSENMKHKGFRIRTHDVLRIIDKISREEFGDDLCLK